MFPKAKTNLTQIILDENTKRRHEMITLSIRANYSKNVIWVQKQVQNPFNLRVGFKLKVDLILLGNTYNTSSRGD